MDESPHLDNSVIFLREPAKLCYVGRAPTENRHGLVVLGGVSQTTGTTERDEALALIVAIRVPVPQPLDDAHRSEIARAGERAFGLMRGLYRSIVIAGQGRSA